MILNEILEDNLPIGILNVRCSEIKDIIKRLYLAEHHIFFLYRGFYTYQPEKIIYAESPINRKPKDMDVNLQIAIDNKLKDTGFTALRSNSIFCTGSQQQASVYSYHQNPYIILPINGFTYTWCRFHDLWSSAPAKYISSSLDLPTNEFINEFQFKNTNLLDAILSLNEIYIHGEYIAISTILKDKLVKEWLQL